MVIETKCYRVECSKIFCARTQDLIRGRARFCSVSCGAIVANSRRNPGTSRTTVSERARDLWIFRHSGAHPLCRKCFKKADIHHKDGVPTNNDPDNHDTLCRSHHVALENSLFPKRHRQV